MGDSKCYFCGQEATSREHVPPQCIFPEKKDAFGEDYKKDLITVPSCEEHNMKKSKDDEFLMFVVSSIVGNNSLGYIQTKTKITRAVKRNPRLTKTIIKNAKEETIIVNGTEFPVLGGAPDMPRLVRSLEYVARGIFYYEYKKVFTGKCSMIPGFIKFEDDLEKLKSISELLFEQEKDKWNIKGTNPNIFEYGVGPVDLYGFYPMYLRFFQGPKTYVGFQPENTTFPFRTLDEATPENPIIITIKNK